MKILFMAPMLNYSGAPKIMIWLANSFCKAGNDVTVLTYNDVVKNKNLSIQVKRICLNIPCPENWFKRNVHFLSRSVYSVYHFIKKNDFDVILTFTDNVSMVSLVLVKVFQKKKFLISERMDPYTDTGRLDKLRRKLFVFSDGIVFQTKNAKEYFSKKVQRKSSVIPNPVIIDFKNKVAETRDNRIVSVGRIDLFQKRQDLLVRAFAKIADDFPEIKVVFYGDGNDIELLKRIVTSCGISDRVTFAGVTNNVYEAIHTARLFVMTSDFEGVPNALIEAMSMGVPVISTDCSPGGAKLLIEDHINGILIPRNDEDTLAERMKYMLSNPKEAEKMGRNGKKIAERFAEDKIFSMWQDFVDKMCYGQKMDTPQNDQI